jgi:hypothetical protein
VHKWKPRKVNKEGGNMEKYNKTNFMCSSGKIQKQAAANNIEIANAKDKGEGSAATQKTGQINPN